MSQVLLLTIITLCTLGVLAAVILYFVAQKFYVYEDPRIDTVESLLPGANCGGCGFAGCRGLADALVREDDIAPLYCPVGGAGNMIEIAEFLGKIAAAKDPEVAVVRCAGACDKRARNNTYDGAASCAVIASLYGGETGCNYGCLGQGDCVDVCNFDAIHVNPKTGLAEVDEEKCTACGACVKACPKMIIELRKKGIKGRRVYVSCINKDKGGIARKACTVACIGCGKCVKICPFEAIALENNLAYIDPQKCKLCRKCVPECPTHAIHEVNFPPRKEPGAKNTAVKPTDAKAEGAVKGVSTSKREQPSSDNPTVIRVATLSAADAVRGKADSTENNAGCAMSRAEVTPVTEKTDHQTVESERGCLKAESEIVAETGIAVSEENAMKSTVGIGTDVTRKAEEADTADEIPVASEYGAATTVTVESETVVWDKAPYNPGDSDTENKVVSEPNNDPPVTGKPAKHAILSAEIPVQENVPRTTADENTESPDNSSQVGRPKDQTLF